MLAKGLLWVGKLLLPLPSLIALGLTGVMLGLAAPAGVASQGGLGWVLFRVVILWGGYPLAGVLVHECGHLLACRVFRVRVREFRVGRADRGGLRFPVRGVLVVLGSPFQGGRVRHDPAPSRGRAAVIVLAGPLANLIAACGLLAVGLATAPPLGGTVKPPEHQAIELSLAALFGATGISNLLPFRTRSGRLSDGGRLLTLGSGRLALALGQEEPGFREPTGVIWRPSNLEEAAQFKVDAAALKPILDDPRAKLPPELLDKWLAAYRDRTVIGLVTAWAVGRTLRMDGRVDELVELFEGYPAPRAGRLAPAMAHSMEVLAYEVVLAPGTSRRLVDMAEDRLQRAIDAHESTATLEDRVARAAVLHSLAVARLRQGHFDVVEDLCATTLATPELLSPTNRATVLATVALARQALGQPYERLLAEATALDPAADLVAEAAQRSAIAGM